jgi:hypothetical protein
MAWPRVCPPCGGSGHADVGQHDARAESSHGVQQLLGRADDRHDVDLAVSWSRRAGPTRTRWLSSAMIAPEAARHG